MRWMSIGLAALVGVAACDKPNLESTEGGYGPRAVPDTAVSAPAISPSDTAPH